MDALWDALLSLISPIVLAALIAAAGVIVTARTAFADITLKRRLETAKHFAELAEISNNHDGKRGTYEMIAALEMVAAFGRDESHLREAARAVLTQARTRFIDKGTPHVFDVEVVTNAAELALARLPAPDPDQPRLRYRVGPRSTIVVPKPDAKRRPWGRR